MNTYLNTEELAARWGLHPFTVANWRCQGKGPKYLKIGKKVLYPIESVELWEAKALRKSTVDKGPESE